ncbi:MAG TPA: ABC transporter substrate-binding protein, partial [Spirochaetia bacterium]
MNTRIRPSSLLAVCALLSACLFVAARAAAEEPPVRIGFVGDFSEVSKSYTDHMLVAAQLAVDMFNAEGGVDGRSVELLVRDGGNDPERHAALVTELVRERGAVAIFGGASTPPTLRASAACRALKVPYLVSIGNSQSIVVENGHPWVFQFQATVPMETKAFSIFATLMPWRRYAWIGPDYSWGHGVLDGFKRQFGAIGTPLVWTAEVWHPL